jgi:Transcription-silencing protein, cryptic loci regulator Clr2
LRDASRGSQSGSFPTYMATPWAQRFRLCSGCFLSSACKLDAGGSLGQAWYGTRDQQCSHRSNGYTLWRHKKGIKIDLANLRTDTYLHGAPHTVFRSPMEFVEHAIWLMHRKVCQCLCKHCMPSQIGLSSTPGSTAENWRMKRTSMAAGAMVVVPFFLFSPQGHGHIGAVCYS